MTSRESRLNLCVKVTCVICSDFLKTGEVRGYTIMSVQTTFLSHLSLLPFTWNVLKSSRVQIESIFFHNLYIPLSFQFQRQYHGR
jgi:hypothetical protein